MGSLYRQRKKLKDGRVLTLKVWWLKYRQHGRTVRESSGTTKETVALRMLRRREGDIERGIAVNPKRDRITVDAAAQDLLTDYRVNRKRSIRVLKTRLARHLLPYFTGRKLATITAIDAREYIAHRQTEGASNGQINRELSHLKRMFTLAMQADKVSHRPYIPMLKEADPRRGFFEREQLNAICRHLSGSLVPVVSFSYHTGWRLTSEVLPLLWSQVDLVAGEVRLEPGQTKTGQGRTFPLTTELRTLLTEQRARMKADQRRLKTIIPWVFYRLVRKGRKGPLEARRVKAFHKAWKRATRLAGCPGRIPHDFRRTAVRNLERSGVPRSTAMAMVGHQTESIYRRYAIVDAAMLKEAAVKIDRAGTR